ncbi:MAG: DivIVA domain-containing protein [Clostridiaceae bacterium]|nr:DivIVA domain-containing protein [Clostridiaceae bacterium]
MKMTSMDIMNRQFKMNIRGYDRTEVDEFIEKVAEDYETIFKENSSFREKMLSFEEKIEHYVKIENTIQNTLLLAQNAADQSKLSAQKEAELIVRNASDSAKRILDKANNDVIRINDDHERLRQEFSKFRTRYRSFLTCQMEMFTDMEMDFVKNYNIGSIIDDGIKEKGIQNHLDEDKFKIRDLNLEKVNSIENFSEVKSFFVEDK